jgi:hypothetical protein
VNENSSNKKKKHAKKGSMDGMGVIPKYGGLLGDDDVNYQQEMLK